MTYRLIKIAAVAVMAASLSACLIVNVERSDKPHKPPHPVGEQST